MPGKQSTGRWGEQAAASYLEEKGFRVLARNFRTPYGEIDLIVEDDHPGASESGKAIIFVEVKTRTTRTFGPPEQAVTPRKQAHLLASIAYYMQQNPQSDATWRLDVIAVENYKPDQPPTIVHFENALSS
jgi:putative endonuclease